MALRAEGDLGGGAERPAQQRQRVDDRDVDRDDLASGSGRRSSESSRRLSSAPRSAASRISPARSRCSSSVAPAAISQAQTMITERMLLKSWATLAVIRPSPRAASGRASTLVGLLGLASESSIQAAAPPSPTSSPPLPTTLVRGSMGELIFRCLGVGSRHVTEAATDPEVAANAETTEAWDGPLFERFVRFREAITPGLNAQGFAALGGTRRPPVSTSSTSAAASGTRRGRSPPWLAPEERSSAWTSRPGSSRKPAPRPPPRASRM